ncbi:hypothetical protein GCM10023083_34560 [Streptomyces phyllanthi]
MSQGNKADSDHDQRGTPKPAACNEQRTRSPESRLSNMALQPSARHTPEEQAMQAEHSTREPECPHQEHHWQKEARKRCRHGQSPSGLAALFPAQKSRMSVRT